MSSSPIGSRTYGYCPMCMQNVEHTRTFSSRLINSLDFLTLRMLRLFRIGPWYCYQCEAKKMYLPPPRRRVPTYFSQEFRSRFQSDLEKEPEANADRPPTTPSVGNYLKTDHSLVMRDKRARKFSQKFRDATIMRVLSGGTTLRQVRRELDVKETDLIEWLANFVNRKQERIEELKLALEAVKSNLPQRLQVLLEENELELMDAGATVVEGRITPR